ncbi:MAG: hypothetical protein JEZ11_00670 [Desulfobacterales bacterium]|nr:hypothetical protein [Desulfobacterales bacterium]
MKQRIVDKLAVKGHRKNTDETWEHFANALIAAFGEQAISDDYFEKIYTDQRMRNFDEKFLDSIIYNVPPAFLAEKHLFANNSDLMAYPKMKSMVMNWKGSEDSPLFILGYVGTGKTSFLRYSFGLKNKLQNECKIGSAIVNLKTAPSTPDRMILFIMKAINDVISKEFEEVRDINREVLKKLFKTEIEDLKKTIKNNDLIEEEIDKLFAPFPFSMMKGNVDEIQLLIKKKIKFLIENNVIGQFWIILDNIDQHYHCLHHRVLIDTVHFASDMGSPMIITMRYISLNSPDAREVYSAFFPRKLNLSLPNIESLLKKRMLLFKNNIEPFYDISLKMTGYHYKISDLVLDLERVLNLLISSDVMQKFILPLSNYNIRRLLQILLNCLQSYYFFYDYFNNDRYLPTKDNLFKRFLFSHCLKNQEYYDPIADDEELFIINLFENENQTTEYNQTIRVRMLQAMNNFGNKIELAEFTKILVDTFDYSKIDILRALRVFLRAQLFAVKGAVDEDFSERIFFQNMQEEDLYSNDIFICITYAGRCHVELLGVIEYLEIMKFSTYVQPEDFHIIQADLSQKSIQNRIKGLKKFVNYLVDEEKTEKAAIVKDQKKYKKYFGNFSEALITQSNRQIKYLLKGLK